MSRSFDPKLDLEISRVIEAPPRAIWNAWTTPSSLERWWVPAPAKCRVVEMDVRPGGGLVTQISEDGGEFKPHLSACFLEIAEGKRIVFTNALVAGWRPAEHPFITAIITLEDHPMGSAYRALVMHRNGADRDRHEELGFHDGWGKVTEQLAALVD